MARIRNLATPPIHEAVIDFMFDLPALKEDAVRALAEEFRSSMGWEAQDIRQISATINLEDPSSAVQSDVFEGVRVSTPEQRQIVQIRGDRITASHVWCYKRWEDLQELAFQAIETFASATNGGKIKRVATRFINAIECGSDPSPILAAPPRSHVEGGVVRDFLDRKIIDFESSSIGVNFQMGTSILPIGFGEDPRRVVLIDIDAYIEGVFDCDEEKLSNVLRDLRGAKNEMFFGAVTEEALEKYS